MLPLPRGKDEEMRRRRKLSVHERWETRLGHHPEAVRLVEAMRSVKGAPDWEFGGDGDDGEELLTVLSEVFDRRDAAWRTKT